MSTHTSSKKLDTSSKKKLSTVTGKKLIKKSQISKRKVAAASVTEKVDYLHSLEDTTTHSFVSELAVLPQGSKQSDESSKSSYSSSENNSEHKGALVETKRLEKQELEEEWLIFREKENVQLQTLLDEKRQKYLQLPENTLSKIKCPYATPGQVSGLARLERQKIIEKGIELSVVEEILTKTAEQRDREVNQLLQRAKNAEASFIARCKEHERQQKIKKVSE